MTEYFYYFNRDEHDENYESDDYLGPVGGSGREGSYIEEITGGDMVEDFADNSEEALSAEHFVCPFCGDAEPAQRLVEWSHGQQRWVGVDPFMPDFICANGHNWGKLPMAFPPKQSPSPTSDLGTSVPTHEQVPIDVSSLVAIICPYCAMGPCEGTYIGDVYPFYMDTRQTVVCCRCDNRHFWSLLVYLGNENDNEQRRAPVKCVFLGPEYHSDTGYPEPDFDTDAVVREAGQIVEEVRKVEEE